MVFFVGGDPLAALPTSVKQKFGALLIDLLISRRFSPAFPPLSAVTLRTLRRILEGFDFLILIRA